MCQLWLHLAVLWVVTALGMVIGIYVPCVAIIVAYAIPAKLQLYTCGDLTNTGSVIRIQESSAKLLHVNW